MVCLHGAVLLKGFGCSSAIFWNRFDSIMSWKLLSILFLKQSSNHQQFDALVLKEIMNTYCEENGKLCFLSNYIKQLKDW